MAFISTVPVDAASAEVRRIYEENEANSGYVPNYVKLFSHRPQVFAAWGILSGSVRGNLDLRHYELVTLAAARALRSTYCMCAHSKVLLQNGFAPAQLAAVVEDFTNADLPPVEVAIMRFSEKVVRDATSITADDVQTLRDHGLTDTEIFDVASAAAMRCFFSKLLDALGAEPDAAYLSLDETLRNRLTVGRQISTEEVEHLMNEAAVISGHVDHNSIVLR
jgi:uncharacterized peroxidase-related enzyme